MAQNLPLLLSPALLHRGKHWWWGPLGSAATHLPPDMAADCPHIASGALGVGSVVSLCWLAPREDIGLKAIHSTPLWGPSINLVLQGSLIHPVPSVLQKGWRGLSHTHLHRHSCCPRQTHLSLHKWWAQVVGSATHSFSFPPLSPWIYP